MFLKTKILGLLPFGPAAFFDLFNGFLLALLFRAELLGILCHPKPKHLLGAGHHDFLEDITLGVLRLHHVLKGEFVAL